MFGNEFKYAEIHKIISVSGSVATRNLCDSANTLLAEGFEGGRNWPMLEACRSLSMFVDVATQMVAAAEANAAAAAAAASAPVPAPATGASEAGDDDTLPNVRTLYHLPQNSNYNPNDDNIEERTFQSLVLSF